MQFEDSVGHGRQQSFTLQDVDVPDPEREGEGSLDTNRTTGQKILLLSFEVVGKCFVYYCHHADMKEGCVCLQLDRMCSLWGVSTLLKNIFFSDESLYNLSF